MFWSRRQPIDHRCDRKNRRYITVMIRKLNNDRHILRYHRHSTARNTPQKLLMQQAEPASYR